MAGAAAIAAALTDHASRYRTLTVGGVDLLLKPAGSPGARYGVPIESVEVVERGPGGVSSMTFEIDDPGKEVAIGRGQVVHFYNVANDYPHFLGFVARRTVRPLGLARTIEIQATGVEAILDWAKVRETSFSWAPGSGGFNTAQAIQRLCSNTLGGTALPLRAFADSPGPGVISQARPLFWNLGNIGPSFPDAPGSITIAEGTTLREAIRQVLAISDGHPSYWDFVTVDFWTGLRAWLQTADTTYATYLNPDGTLPTLVVEDVGSSPLAAADLADTLDGTAPVSVFVRGTGSVSAVMTDGSGDLGEMAYLSEPAATDAQTAALAGQRYLRQFAPDRGEQESRRGTFRLEDVADATMETVRPGDWVDLVDHATGLQTSQIIGELTHRFHATTQDVTVTYGGLRPSMAALIRRVTRATPN